MSLELEETVSPQETLSMGFYASGNATMVKQDINEEETKNDQDQFKSDFTVPAGWSFKGILGSGKNFLLKCPMGSIYRSRADAYEKMYSSGKYSQEEIEALKHCLKYERWKDTDTIPKGWIIKRRKKHSIHLIEQGGKKFLSALKAYEKASQILFNRRF